MRSPYTLYRTSGGYTMVAKASLPPLGRAVALIDSPRRLFNLHSADEVREPFKPWWVNRPAPTFERTYHERGNFAYTDMWTGCEERPFKVFDPMAK